VILHEKAILPGAGTGLILIVSTNEKRLKTVKILKQ
jgi:hypothetical protein